MFASWKPVSDADGRNVLLCKRPHRPVACSQCRAQKVRCTSERDGEGCSRCQAQRRKCTYPPRRGSAAVSGEDAPDSTDTELQSDPPELPTPAPTEVSRRPASSASTSRAEQDWINESQGGYPNGIDFSNFPLDQEFARYSAFTLMGSYDIPTARPPNEHMMPMQEQPAFRRSQHTEIYSAESRTPRSQSRLPQAESLFSGQAQTQGRPGPQRSGGSDCQCLHRVVVLMDELELLGEPAQEHPPVDGILVVHRKAMRLAEDMLACASCASRVDHMIILTFLVSKLTDLCCRAVSTLSSHCAARAAPTARQQGVGEALVTTIGAYRIENEAEHVAVARVLLHIGLDRLLGLVCILQEVGRRLGSETMTRRLGVCRRTIGLMLDGR